ncbi:hypothetical protein HORIV_57970 [Vreelandella olivaria]|uniref:DUF4123 domain-containing protein n=1 Tax=Vreelandella olivaria TaxID=390919 RepID=A0ABM7GNN0_9GAMM|nr:hypothetical protein HORIV_57970 [Halomonas olivaria]
MAYCIAGCAASRLTAFLAQGLDDEWGYLIESRAPLEEVGNHLRHMLQVRHPSGGAMWLRLADPAVIAALLLDQSTPAMAPWGPIESLVCPDAVANEWGKAPPECRRTTRRDSLEWLSTQ